VIEQPPLTEKERCRKLEVPIGGDGFPAGIYIT